MTALRACGRLLALLLLLLAVLPARADTAISLLQSYRGTVNFVGTEQTLRKNDNTASCTINSNNTVYASVSGVPAGAKILSAQLYWAGSGNTPDYSVIFDGVAVTASSTRRYTSATIGSGFNYFSGAADVTTLLQTANGSHSFSGLAVDAGSPWCNSQGVLGGFSLVVIYSHASEPFRMLNLYEGFKYFQNSGFKIDLGNFNIPNPLPAEVTGRIGHVTWEGDATLSQGGESLLFNDVELSDTINPAGNQFNSASSANGDKNSYGVDFDIYTLKSPIIAPGQSTATTTYKSGQDMVMLSAEIVAMPYVANADLALSMTRSGDLRVGATSTYTLGVSNVGIDTEAGPVTVVDTLPSGLKLVSTGGSGWNCTDAAGANGATVVTCTHDGPLAGGASMSSLTLTVSPDAAGTYNNTATVFGKTGDNNSANNTASNSAGAIDAGSQSVVFTTEICKNGDPLVIAPSATGCHRFIGPVVAAANNSKIYMTLVGGANKATAVGSSDTTATIELRATCLPYSDIAKPVLRYAGVDLDCKGGWKSVTVTVPGGKPTATLPDAWTLSYNDVGRITLSMRYQSYVTGTVSIISRPYDVRFRAVQRVADGVADLKGGIADGFAKDTPKAFAAAGEPFILRLGALMANNDWAPSFGQEWTALTDMPEAVRKLVVNLDKFSVNPLSSPVLPVLTLPRDSNDDGKIDANDVDLEVDTITQRAFVLDQDFALNSASPGAIEARARWFEAGYLALTPSLASYLGTDPVGGAPAGVAPAAKERLVGGTRVIGHFYPDHFTTTLVAGLPCAPSMNCPAVSSDATKPSYPLEGAVYSTQPVDYAVIPYSLPREGENGEPATPRVLALFRNLAGSAANANIAGGTTYRNVALLRVAKPTDASAAVSALKGAFAPVPANAFPTSSSPLEVKSMKGKGAYTLAGSAYDPKNRSAQTTWSAPEVFYLRASMKEKLVTGPATTKDIEVSSGTPGAAPSVQYEAGLVAISGRLLVPNVFGSELLRLPLGLSAQYWNGTAWLTSATDSTSTVAQTLVPSKCTKAFAASCDGATLVFASGATGVQLDKGVRNLFLQSPGRGKTGSVDFTLGSALAPWLPSTPARATFGLYKSPLIYLREVY
jgi:uncharacterized repeat protein (TIGR01451 family)